MSFYHSSSGEEERAQALESLPLPEPAIIIDVRQKSIYDASLLAYLAIDMEHLTLEMHLKQIPRWRHLGGCIDFVRLDAMSPDATLDESTDFVLTTRAEKRISISGRKDLAQTLGRDYLDRVRNRRISATKDSGPNAIAFNAEAVDSAQPPVRVLFLTDMEESASLARAATYARWLKEWLEEVHGPKRLSRDERIQTVTVCLNAVASAQDILIDTLGQPADTAMDIVILVQTYSDDEAYLGDKAQIYQAELLLYTLLLHWPQLFWKTITDAPLLGINTLPCATYTLGIAALEYSAKWSARWFDYGTTAKLLETIRESKQVDSEGQTLSDNIHKWLKNWWQEVQSTVPDTMILELDELQIFNTLPWLLASSSFLKSDPSSSVKELETFSRQVSATYTGTNTVSLQQGMEGARSLLDQFQWLYTNMSEQGGKSPEQIDESYRKLASLYTKLRRFLPSHFQGAWGALPRATSQLAALTKSIETIQRVEHNPPNLPERRRRFERQAAKAQKDLDDKLKFWQLLFLGPVLRSTVISWMICIGVALILLVGLDWSSGVASMLTTLSASFARYHDTFVWGLKGLAALLLLGGEVLYLRERQRSLALERKKIHDDLCHTVQTDLDDVRAVLAARVALTLLQWADLYTPRESMSPYEQRLRDVDKVLENAQERAAQQQSLAGERLQLTMAELQRRADQNNQLSDLNNRRDLLTWERMDDAFLEMCKELTSPMNPVNSLTETLLRRLGTETPVHIVRAMLKRRGNRTQNDREARFQAVSTMLVALLLTVDGVKPDIGQILPLLKEYIALKDFYLPEPSALGNVLDLQPVVKDILMEQALPRQKSTSSNTSSSTKLHLPAERVLTAWVGHQRSHTPQLTEVLEANNLLERLLGQKLSGTQTLDFLRQRSVLLGYSDKPDEDDYFCLLLAPGAAEEIFLESLDPQETQVHLESFPDEEKLVYLHIHCIRQLELIAGNAPATKDEKLANANG